MKSVLKQTPRNGYARILCSELRGGAAFSDGLTQDVIHMCMAQEAVIEPVADLEPLHEVRGILLLPDGQKRSNAPKPRIVSQVRLSWTIIIFD